MWDLVAAAAGFGAMIPVDQAPSTQLPKLTEKQLDGAIAMHAMGLGSLWWEAVKHEFEEQPA